MRHEIHLVLNGEEQVLEVEASQTLLQVLRDRLHVTSPKRSCEQGECGACTVILNGKAVNSCLVLAVTVHGKAVETVEGLGNDAVHPLQKHFQELAASQCGYCTPGMLLTAQALIKEHPEATREEIREYMSGNLCRCTGYQAIIDAIETVLRTPRKEVLR